MKTRTFQKLWIAAVFLPCLVSVFTARSASGLEVYVIGGETHPWKEMVWDEADPGAAIEVIDFEALPGWIVLTKTDTTENIALRTYKRGGKVTVPNVSLSSDEKATLKGIVSGDPTEAFDRKTTPGRKMYNLGVMVDLDLGARFGVNRVRFFPRMSEQYPFQDDFMRAYDVYLNDGTEETAIEGRPIFKIIEHNEKNDQAVVDLEVPLQYVRYIRIKSLTAMGWEIDEIEVFGAGFVPEATYESQVFDFGDVATLGRIWWSEQKIGDPTKSQIIVRTRSGGDDTPLVYYRKVGGQEEVEVSEREYRRLELEEQGEIRYYTKEGKEVSKRDYEALPPEEKGNIKYYRIGGEVPFDKKGNLLTKASYDALSSTDRGSILVDREHGWSGWSAPYDYEAVREKGGVPILSPAPRRYFQFRVDLKSNDLGAAASVDSLAFEISKPPVAHEIVAEIAPREVVPGEVVPFTYALRSDIRGEDTGFDRFEIATPTKVDTIQSVWIDGQEVDFDRIDSEEDHFTVGFPRIASDEVLTVIFRGTVLRYGTLFAGKAFDSQTGELKQSVVGGDATPEIATNDISVRIALGGSLIGPLGASPNPFTPNGDGINDEVSIYYSLFRLTRKMPLSLKIYDLSGTVVRELLSEGKESSLCTVSWDGKDDDGHLVPPGVYVVRVGVDTDSGVESKVRTVSVVY